MASASPWSTLAIRGLPWHSSLTPEPISHSSIEESGRRSISRSTFSRNTSRDCSRVAEESPPATQPGALTFDKLREAGFAR